MPALFDTLYRRVTAIVGAAAFVGWLIAYAQAAPRLAAGPLCSGRQDLLTLAGHCGACGVATLLTMLFVTGVTLERRHALAAQRARR